MCVITGQGQQQATSVHNINRKYWPVCKACSRFCRIIPPENKLLNYIVGLYYKRGMVTFAAFIADKFTEFAWCGNEKPNLSVFPSDFRLVHADGSDAGELGGG